MCFCCKIYNRIKVAMREASPGPGSCIRNQAPVDLTSAIDNPEFIASLRHASSDSSGNPGPGPGNQDVPLEDYIFYCVQLGNVNQGYIVFKKGDLLGKQQINKFIKKFKTDIVRDIGFDFDYNYLWSNRINNTQLPKSGPLLENLSSSLLYNSILFKRAKNIPVSYDKVVTTLTITKITKIDI